jgi:hypothetical protein
MEKILDWAKTKGYRDGDGSRHDVSELVPSGALMEPWVAVVSAVAARLVSSSSCSRPGL